MARGILETHGTVFPNTDLPILYIKLYLRRLTLIVVRGLLYFSKLAMMRNAIGKIRLMPDTTKGRSNFSSTSFSS